MDDRKTLTASTGEQPVRSEGRAMLEEAFAQASGHPSDATPVAIERTEHSVMEGLPPAKAERIAAMRRELAELQRQLTEAQQRITTELQGRAEDAERLEAIEARLHAHEAKAQDDAAHSAELVTEVATLRAQLSTVTASADALGRDLASRDAQLEKAREQQRSATEPLERELEDQRKSLRDATALIASRDGELAAITSERDAVKGELAATRARMRDLVGQLVELTRDAADVQPPTDPKPTLERPKPPPVPAQVTASRPVEAILEVTEEPPSKLRSGLMLLCGVVLGCAATTMFVTWRGSDRDEREQPSVSRSPAQLEPKAARPPTLTPEPAFATPSTAPRTVEKPAPPPPPPAEVTTDGVIVLPPEAADHRVYVDGHVVTVKSSRAVVACGSREIRIGSQGTPRAVDVTCGGETSVPMDTHDR